MGRGRSRGDGHSAAAEHEQRGAIGIDQAWPRAVLWHDRQLHQVPWRFGAGRRANDRLRRMDEGIYRGRQEAGHRPSVCIAGNAAAADHSAAQPAAGRVSWGLTAHRYLLANHERYRRDADAGLGDERSQAGRSTGCEEAEPGGDLGFGELRAIAAVREDQRSERGVSRGATEHAGEAALTEMTKHQEPSTKQAPIFEITMLMRRGRFGHFEFGLWNLFGIRCLVIGALN